LRELANSTNEGTANSTNPSTATRVPGFPSLAEATGVTVNTTTGKITPIYRGDVLPPSETASVTLTGSALTISYSSVTTASPLPPLPQAAPRVLPIIQGIDQSSSNITNMSTNAPPTTSTGASATEASSSLNTTTNNAAGTTNTQATAALNHPRASLPPSQEEAYKRKSIQLRKRLREVEEANDEARLRKIRLVRAVRKQRLLKAMLLEKLKEAMESGDYDRLDGDKMEGIVNGDGLNGDGNGGDEEGGINGTANGDGDAEADAGPSGYNGDGGHGAGAGGDETDEEETEGL
jgi:hypothetical protein